MAAYVLGNPISNTDPTGEIVPWVAGAILGGIAGGVGAALQGGSWQQVALGVGIGAVGGATFGGIGGAMIKNMGPGMMAWFRGGAGVVGNVLGQNLVGFGNPCFKLNIGAVAGAAVGGAVFGTLNAQVTAGLISDGAAMGLGARLAWGLPGALAQGGTTAVGGGIGAPASQCGCP